MTAPDGKRLRYVEIADDIRDRIRAGKLPAGSRIGTFGSLGEEYGAAKGTVDKALDVLRYEGAVVTIAGKGIYVADNADTGTSPGRDIRRMGEQIEALSEEVGSLQARVQAAEAQAGAVSELREVVAGLQAQIMNLYHSVGQPYPYEQNAATAGREAV